MLLQVNIFLLLFGVLQGILLTAFFVKKKIYKTGYFFLLLYLTVIILQIMFKVINKGWLMDNWGTFYTLSYQLPFLYGPLLWMFTHHLADNRRKFQFYDLLHFVPFVLVVLMSLIVRQDRPDPVIVRSFFMASSRCWLQLASVVVYHLLALQFLKRYRASNHNMAELQDLKFHWLKGLLLVSLVITSVITVLLCLLYLYYPFGYNFRYGFLILTCFIYWVSYTALTQPEIFMIVRGGMQKDEKFVPNLVVHRKEKQYAHSGLREEEATRILKGLDELMPKQKPYLDAEITIDMLAVMLQTNRHHLSEVLNRKNGKSFYEFVNYYRVEEAKTLLLDPAYANHKIASIAYDAGFNSLSTFNDVFKKMSGRSPSQYKKSPGEDLRKQRV